MQLIQQSESTAARRRIFFHAVDATDGITAETGLTGTGFISKNGATPIASASITQISATNMPGRYYVELTAAQVDTLGVLEFRFKTAACAEVFKEAQIVPWDPYDATRMGLTALPNADAEAAGGLYTRGSGAGQIAQTNNGRIDIRQERRGSGRGFDILAQLPGEFDHGRRDCRRRTERQRRLEHRQDRIHADAGVPDQLRRSGHYRDHGSHHPR